LPAASSCLVWLIICKKEKQFKYPPFSCLRMTSSMRIALLLVGLIASIHGHRFIIQLYQDTNYELSREILQKAFVEAGLQVQVLPDTTAGIALKFLVVYSKECSGNALRNVLSDLCIVENVFND
jgi:hypothetical protein